MTAKASDEEDDQRDRFIVLLRHGIAEEKSGAKKDEERSLTADGHARMKQIAKGLERVLPRVQEIHSSTLLRAVQTALWVSKGYRSRVKVETTNALAPSASTDDFLAFLKGLAARRVILVGHEPTLSNWLKALVGAKGDFELKKGGCYGVRITSDGKATLEWLLSPRVLRRLGEGG